MKETMLKEFKKVFGDTEGVKVFLHRDGSISSESIRIITAAMFFPVH